MAWLTPESAQARSLVPETIRAGVTKDLREYEVQDGTLVEITPDLYHLQSTIDLPAGGDELSYGENYSIGLKVWYVCSYLKGRNYLRSSYTNTSRYLSDVMAAVKNFQIVNNLEPTGIVDYATWKAMGYSGRDYYDLARYVSPLKVSGSGHSRQEYIDALLETAAEYERVGTFYLDGASGRPGTAVDCSGFILQCLYSVGIDPEFNTVVHTGSQYEFGSRYLSEDERLGIEVSVNEILPGDLVFYSIGGTVCHVALYIGDGIICDSDTDVGVSYGPLKKNGYEIAKVVRLF